MEHGEQRRQAGAAGQHQQRTIAVAQIEAAHGSAEGQAIAGLRPLRQPLAHHPPGHIADQKTSLPRAGKRAKGIGADVGRTRHLDIDVLSRQEGQRLIESNHQLDGGVRQQIDLLHLRPERRQGGFALGSGHRHINHAVAGGHHLTGQHLAGLRFLVV